MLEMMQRDAFLFNHATKELMRDQEFGRGALAINPLLLPRVSLRFAVVETPP